MLRLLLALFLLAAALDTQSQVMPRRDRVGSPRDSQSRDREPQRPAAAQDPISALERELPSLKVDLMLTADQVAMWISFERDVRDIAEMGRARRRHIMALREAGDRAPTAVTFVATLAEEDRQKAEATADLRKHLEALYEKLDDKQRGLLDRRMVLSQTEPLGR